MSGEETFRPTPDSSVTLRTEDDHRFTLSLFKAADQQGPITICFPAMGVKARNYHALADVFRKQGRTMVVAELRGHGSSSWRASRQQNYGYREMLEQDWPAVINAVAEQFPEQPIYLLGHSLGGQLSCLYAAANSDQVAGIMVIGSCSVYYRAFGLRGLGLRMFIPLIKLIVGMKGYFPGHRLGFARREGAQVMHDWGYQGRTGRYLIKGSRYDYETLLSGLTCPVLNIMIEGDKFAPKKAIQHLMDKMDQAERTLDILNIDRKGKMSPHFSWFNQPDRAAHKMLQWLNAH